MKRRRSGRPQRGAYKKKPHTYKVLCSVCETEFLVPVAPPAGKSLTCLNCLQGARRQNEGGESGLQARLAQSEADKREISG